ncbi:hypothetical protein B0I35DRAFT_326898, partial [Stachybotrys elegans]
VQVSDSSVKSIPAGRADPFDIAYRTLWLFAYREYEEMPVEVKKKVAGPAKGQANEEILFEFASLAHKLGFRSDQIESLRHGDPDREIARRLLLTARSPNRFRYNDLDGCIRQVAGLIKSAQAISDGEGMDDGRWIDDGKPERSGKPKPHDHLRDKSKMFINTLHTSLNRETTVSSFFIQRSSYFAFFGKDCKIDMTLINDMPGETVDQHSPQMIEEDPEGQDQHEHVMHMMEVQQAKLDQLAQRERELQKASARIQGAIVEQQSNLSQLVVQVAAKQSTLDQLTKEASEKTAFIENLESEE